MNEETIEPTPRAWLLLVAAFVLALAWKLRLQPELFAYINSLPVCQQLPWWRGVLIGVVVSPCVAFLWMGHYAYRVLHHGQSPPPGTWVLRRTPIRRGAQARRKGYGALVAAVLGMAVTIASGVLISKTPFFDAGKRTQCSSRLSPGGMEQF